MKEKSPAVQWYPKQYLGDDKVIAMEWDAKGMHHWLLNISWQQEPRGTIPNDTGLIRRWLGSPSDEIWRRVWPQIKESWLIQDGRFVNAGMLRAAQRQETFSKRRSKDGKSPEEEGLFAFVPDWVPKKPWKDFVEMRERIRKPLTQNAIELLVNKLDKLREEGSPPGDVLNQSVIGSYQGVFELKKESNGNHKPHNPGVFRPDVKVMVECWGCRVKFDPEKREGIFCTDQCEKDHEALKTRK